MSKSIHPARPSSFSTLLASFDREIAGLVRRYASESSGNTWDDDIRQEASLALHKCVNSGKVKPDAVTGLLDEAGRRIVYMEMKHAVHVSVMPLRQSLTVSACTVDKYRKLGAELARLSEDVEALTIGEIASLLKVSRETARNLVTLRRKNVSLNAPAGHDTENAFTLSDLLHDDSADHPADKLISQERRAEAYRLLNSLPDRRRDLVARRLGLMTGEEISCADLAAERGCSRQAIDEQFRLALRAMRMVGENAPQELAV